MIEPRDLSGLADLALQFEPELLDILDRGQRIGARHLAAECDKKLAAIGELHVGQRCREPALRISRNRLQDAEQFFQCTKPLVERRAGRNDLGLLVLE